MTLLNWLDRLDKSLFVIIQHDSDHTVLDWLMPILREPLTWIPLYVGMLLFVLFKSKNKALPFIVLSVVTFAFTDSLAAQVLKPLFARLRPCHDPEMQSVIRSLVECGGFYSMPSNHAANHFALAAFWFFALRSITGKKYHWLWFWAAAVCYAQVYVGKHYPFDVLIGGLTGFLTGLGMSRLFLYWENKHNHRPPFFGPTFKKSPGMGSGL
ncbi:MAG: phosphatase PAP2 family protein [Bacteroidetes bacterium]|nr:phosphatase PAP2 family protein [Bacteroidota bacterium]